MSSLAGKRRWVRKNKYGNIPCIIDGIRFDSKGEGAYWQELRLRERAGEIADLKRQVPFRLDVNGFHICRYISDFTYVSSGELIVEDFKSVATANEPVFKLKRALMLACHGISVRVVGKP